MNGGEWDERQASDQVEHVEAARVAGRDEARKIGRRTIWAVLAAFLIFGGAITVTTTVYVSINRQACHDRQEARDGIRDTLFDLVLTRPDPARPGQRVVIPSGEWTEGQARIAARISEGGKLAPISC